MLAAPLAVVLVALLAAVPAGAATPSRRCAERDSARCLSVPVPLDRSGALPGTIDLRVRFEPPPSGGAARDTILVLAGGPGQAGTPLLEQIAFGLPQAVLRGRRVVTFDPRGTGDSGELRCPELALINADGALAPNEAVQGAVAGCANRLGAARAHYTTADTVADIEAVREALGVERLILYGTSYGTKVALDYAAVYPQHVSRLLLDSVVLPEGMDPFERSTLAAIPRVMRAVCARGGCPFTRDAAADVAALVQRLARGPLHGRFVDGRGRGHMLSLVRRDVFTLLVKGDLLPGQRALLPAAVRAAREGDPALLLRLAAARGPAFGDSGGDSLALYLATTCEDGGAPWAAGTPVEQRSAAVAAALAAISPAELAPFGLEGVRDFGFADLCRAWPEAPIAQPHAALPQVPTLILSGDEDLRTPRSTALELAARIPGARVVAVPQTAHSVLAADPSHCARDAVAAFFSGRVPRACHRRRLDPLSAPAPLPPRSLRSVAPLAGLPPRTGRTLVAVGQTLADWVRAVEVELLPALTPDAVEAGSAFRLGGLRGGSVMFTRRAILLRRYSYVPGVELSVRIVDEGSASPDTQDDPPLAVRIGGRAAAHGWLRVGERWTSGRLDGRPVRVRTRRLVPLGASAASAPAASAHAAAVRLARLSQS